MKRIPLWSLVAASLAGYGAIAVVFPLSPSLHRVPLPDFFEFVPSLGAGLAYCGLVVALFGGYWLAYRRARGRPLSLPVILLVAAACGLPLILTFPYNSTDIYRYFIRARVLVVHGASPFATPPSAFPGDPFLPLAGEWATATSPYGPVWELVAAGITWMSGGDLQGALIAFKSLALVLHLASGALIWASLGGEAAGVRAGRTLLWAWNPALLLIWAANGHNDALMLTWLLLGWWLLERRRPLAGLLVAALAPLTKPIALLVFPLLALAALRREPDARSRVRLLLAAAAGSLGLALVAFLPFVWQSGEPGRSLVALIERLLTEAGEGGGFSPVAMVILLVRHGGGDVPLRWATGGAGLLFGVFAFWLLWRTARGRSAVRSAVDVVGGYLVQAFKFRIWYAAWPLPWLLLDRDGPRWRLTAGLWFLLTSQLSVFIYGHLWRLALDQEHVWSHLVGVPFTFVLPLVAAIIQRSVTRHD